MIVNFTTLEAGKTEYIPQFLDMLTDTIRNEVWSHLNMVELSHKGKLLLDVPWISWYKKPKLVKVRRLVQLILHSLQWVPISHNSYKLRIDPRKRIPGSATPLSQLARWLEYGDEGMSRPMLFLVHAQNLVKPKVRSYWKAFIQSKEGVLRVHERVYVR